MRGQYVNAKATPLLVCVTALAIAALILGLIATGLASTAGPAAPAWSGKQAPPGAVGLSPERAALHGVAGPGPALAVR